MIIAYARLVGLNPQDISRMYLDQEYAHQVEKAHRSVGNTIQMHNEPYQHSGSTQRGTAGRFNQVDRSSRNYRSSYNSDQTRATQRTTQSNAYDGSSNGFEGACPLKMPTSHLMLRVTTLQLPIELVDRL